MSIKIQNILAGALILTGFLYFIRNQELQTTLLGAAFFIYGIFAVLFSFGTSKHGILILGVFLFLTGLELLLPLFYVINYSAGYFATSVFFILGAANLMLFLSARELKFHLFLGILLIVVSFLIPHSQTFWPVDLAVDKTVMILVNIWPVILIIAGVGILTSRKTGN